MNEPDLRFNVLRMLEGISTQRPPFDIRYTQPARERIERHCTDTPGQVEILPDFGYGRSIWPVDEEEWRRAYTAMGVTVPQRSEFKSFGIVEADPGGDPGGLNTHLRTIFHPLADTEDCALVESLPWPDPEDGRPFEGLRETVENIHETGKAAVFARECTIFERAWYLRSMESLFMDILDEEGPGIWLLDFFTDFSCREVAHAARAGFDIIGLGDDIGSQKGMIMSPAMWREHLKPRLAKVIQSVRDNETSKVWIYYHSDGDVREVIDDLIEIGIDILNPLQPECMPIEEVITGYKDRLAFWGGIGTQTTMPFGSPEEVCEKVQELRDLASAGARIIISPTHVIEPDVPVQNVLALHRASTRLA